MGQRTAIIVAGLHARDVVRDLAPAIALLHERGVRIVAVHPLVDMAGVTEIVTVARECGVRLVIAAGGDGTVGLVANGLVYSDMSLGILPFGTSNDFARSLGVPMRLVDACSAIANAAGRQVDLGLMVTDAGVRRYFVHAVSVGLNSAFARLATKVEWRRRYGRLAYPIALSQVLRQRQHIGMRITADGQVQQGQFLQVTAINAPLFGGALAIQVPDATLTDLRLDLLVVGDMRLWQAPQAARVLVQSRIRRAGPVYLLHPKTARIETETLQDVVCDGELIGKTPVTVETANRALHVIGGRA